MALLDPRVLAQASSSIATTCPQIKALTGEIRHDETEIDRIVKGLFTITKDEVALIEHVL